jgi:hypothetical protein
VSSSIEEIENLFGNFLSHRDDAPIIDDPKSRRENALEEDIEILSSLSLGDLCSESLHAGAVNAETTVNSLDSQSESEMGFSSPWLSKKESDLSPIDKSEGGELIDEVSIDIRIEVPIELLEGCYLGELCSSNPGLDSDFPPRIDFSS